MKAKDYLLQIRDIKKRILQIRQQLRQLDLDMSGLKSPDLGADRVVSSSSGDKMLRLIIKHEAEYRRLMNEQDRLITVRSRICQEIESLEDGRHREILTYRYVLLMRWPEIAEAMSISESHMYRLHGDALEAFHKKMRVNESK